MTKKQEIVVTVLTVIVFMLLLALTNRVWFRLDITKNKSYTIAPVSRLLYTELPDKVRISYYISSKLRSTHPIPREIEDILREYATYSHGMIEVTVVDPADRSAELEMLGIEPQQIQTIERDEATITTVYTGIVLEYRDRIEVLPFVFSLNTLEYDITSRIRAMVQEQERRIGIALGDSRQSLDADYPYIVQALSDAGYRPMEVSVHEEIPASLPVIIVLADNVDLSINAQYRLDQYIQNGGHVLFALNAVHIAMTNTLEAQMVERAGLLEQLAYYGATIEDVLVLDRAANMLQYQIGNQIRLVRYPLWISVPAEQANAKHPISAHFSGADLFWSSPITLTLLDGVESFPLFSSTDYSWLQRKEFVINPDLTVLMEQEAPDTTGAQILAAALSGTFPRFFSEKPPSLSANFPDMPSETQASRLVIIGDSDLFSSYIRATGSSRNLEFLIQAVDWLSNDEDIISIRNRTNGTGRLDKISDIQQRNMVMTFSRTFNMIIMPLLVLGIGIFLNWKRKTQRY
ncbi:MAG: GldG family protein [Treponema sp.]|jgi:gliding-associated putative ABC transporter substrate-binding component GldG|nr:GldG family protein [Treponema sp.]